MNKATSPDDRLASGRRHAQKVHRELGRCYSHARRRARQNRTTECHVCYEGSRSSKEYARAGLPPRSGGHPRAGRPEANLRQTQTGELRHRSIGQPSLEACAKQVEPGRLQHIGAPRSPLRAFPHDERNDDRHLLFDRKPVAGMTTVIRFSSGLLRLTFPHPRCRRFRQRLNRPQPVYVETDVRGAAVRPRRSNRRSVWSHRPSTTSS